MAVLKMGCRIDVSRYTESPTRTVAIQFAKVSVTATTSEALTLVGDLIELLKDLDHASLIEVITKGIE